jgi:diaminopimelate decarboxylase
MDMWWEVPRHLIVRKGRLYLADTPAVDIAKKFGTPLYAYNSKRIVEVYRKFHREMDQNTDCDVRVHYPMKANSNRGILQLLRKEGAWIDAVSPGEAALALELGFPEERILFTGVSVSNEDLKKLTGSGVRINIDSLSELKRLKSISSDVEISLRMDPSMSGVGHNWKTITAGRTSHGVPIKFSIPENEILKAVRLAKEYGFKVVGLHEHIGSNWRREEELKEFLKTVDILLEKAGQMTEILGYDLEFVDFGGGPGVRYEQHHQEFPLERYAKEICNRVDDCGIDFAAICFEPGRYIVADSGLLLVEVVDIKERYGDVIIGVNSGFNHLARIAMYGSYHEIINCTKADAEAYTQTTVVGNLCETGDVFTPTPRMMPMPEEGDILAIHNAGAYGFSMASCYNMRSLPREVIV